MTSRRRFLGLSIAGAAGACAAGSGALGIADAVARPASSPWTFTTWAALAKAPVTALDAAGRRHRWTVSSVRRVAKPQAKGDEAFTVRFSAAHGEVAEGTYRISHARTGRFLAFVTSTDTGATMSVQRTTHR